MLALAREYLLLTGQVILYLYLVKKAVFFFVLLCLAGPRVFAQEDIDPWSDKSMVLRAKQNKITRKVFKAISTKQDTDSVFVFKSEDAFIPFEGKIIRKIIVENIHFNRTVKDTSRVIKNKLVDLGEALHTDSREDFIRNNLFIREGQPLNPFRVADNERYLRDLDFIKDSKIFVIQHNEQSDSVDLLVMTRDVFSLGASFAPGSASKFNFKVQEANLAGTGVQLSAKGLVQSGRSPMLGYELLAKKRNLWGTFVDASLGVTTINSAVSLGNENESAIFARLDRPLFMPFARWAGGFELSRNWSENTFNKNDSLFMDYAYTIQDLWAGFTFGETWRQRNGKENRHRRMLAGRILNQSFIRKPNLEAFSETERNLTDRVLALGQVTFFKQNFYKTKYVVGFGRTEDIPYGYLATLTTGWERQNGSSRPYWGAELQKSFFSRGGNFLTIDAQAGSFLQDGQPEDVLIQFTGSYFSKIFTAGRFKVRHFAEAGYSQYIERTNKLPLDINNLNGIPRFRPDSLYGDGRWRLQLQAMVFTPWKLLGFNFAIVPQFDFATLTRANPELLSNKLFQSYSLGIRTRNENLIFNTIEVRVHHFTRTIEDIGSSLISFSTNLRIKYPTSIVKAPRTIFDP